MSTADFVRGRLGHIDLGVWRDISPAQLASSPEMVAGYQPSDAAARALKYARMAGSLPYDEIGFRQLAATPVKGYVPMQTFTQARLDAERERRRRSPADLDLLLAQTRLLRHRPLQIPAGRISFTLQEDLISLRRVSEPDEPDDGIVWSFPLGAPPTGLMDMAEDHDEAPILASYSPTNVPLVYWLPLPSLIQTATFGRMQDITKDLVSGIQPGCHYCFLSHRWLTASAPDPKGAQARLTAWQLVAAMCEAVYVAYERGLRTPRKVSNLASMPIGPFGSSIAEAFIVNVLRHVLDDASLAEVHAEILPLQRETADRGVAVGHADASLSRLRELVEDHPLLWRLLDHVRIWNDYSCLPQPPRTPAEQEEFEHGLSNIEIIQLLGRTAILLDDADDYLTRAWCTLEALTADVAHNSDVLVGADRPTVLAGRTEHHLATLLQDRPHVVWRGLLDTEVFGVQTPLECLRRLELAATEPADLPVIYEGLCRLGMPTKIHTDESEILTGTVPLPLVDRGRGVVLPTASGTNADSGYQPVATRSLNWIGAGQMDRARTRSVIQASYVDINGRGRRSCHVAVVGSCEGEAMLIADWTLAHTKELSDVIGGVVRSLSWLATDVAPVGHFADGVLRTTTVGAPLWVVVAAGARFQRCSTTTALVNTIIAAGLPYVTVAIDSSKDNAVRHEPVGRPAGERGPSVDARQATMAEWPGGLFRDHLFDELRRAVAGERW